MIPAMPAQCLAFGGPDQPERLLETRDVILGFLKVSFDGGSEVVVARAVGHCWKRFTNWRSASYQIAQFIDEHVLKGEHFGHL